jgi:hypothetical protein
MQRAPIERGRAIEVLSPAASPEEAAAIVAAVEHFMRETAPREGETALRSPDHWWRAGILEGVESDCSTELREPWTSA